MLRDLSYAYTNENIMVRRFWQEEASENRWMLSGVFVLSFLSLMHFRWADAVLISPNRCNIVQRNRGTLEISLNGFCWESRLNSILWGMLHHCCGEMVPRKCSKYNCPTTADSTSVWEGCLWESAFDLTGLNVIPEPSRSGRFRTSISAGFWERASLAKSAWPGKRRATSSLQWRQL